MRKFVVNVNGVGYNVEVEEQTSSVSGGASAPVAAPAVVAPAAQPVVAPAPAAAAPAEGVQVKSPMPGTILDIKLSVGATVKAGDIIVILEAMKMENEILAPSDGKIVNVNVSKGQSVNTGDVLAVIS